MCKFYASIYPVNDEDVPLVIDVLWLLLVLRHTIDCYVHPMYITLLYLNVVKYLIELDVNGRILEHCDTNKDSVLHFACHGGNLRVIKYLLDNHASLVSYE